nr:hypothetical protein [Gammaproteobacteria bacterium]
VVVRRTDQPVAPLLPPESEFFLYQNLRLQLESSRLALLHGEPEAYRDHLHTARDWVKSYFDTEAAPTRAMLNKIGELAALEIRPELPDISGSLHALQRVAGSNAQAEAQGRQSAEPSSPAEAPAAEEQPAPAAQPPATADEAAQPQAAPEGGTP